MRDLYGAEADRTRGTGVYRASFRFVSSETLGFGYGPRLTGELMLEQERTSLFFPDSFGASDVLNAVRQAFARWLCTGPERAFSTYWSGQSTIGGGLTVFGWLDRLGRIAWARPFDALLESEGGLDSFYEVAEESPCEPAPRARRRKR